MLLTALIFSIFACHVNLERPHLTIVQGIVESNLNANAVGSSNERGAWQAREMYWGKVPNGLAKQAVHAEQILNTIKQERNVSLFEALCRYNGKGKKSVRYACKVRRMAIELSVMTYTETSIFDVRGVANVTL